jgi:6-phosphofructokinase 1
MVIVVAEGAGQDLIAQSMNFVDTQDASGNKLLLDVGLWLSQKIKVRSSCPNFHFLVNVGTNEALYLFRSFKCYTEIAVILTKAGLFGNKHKSMS